MFCQASPNLESKIEVGVFLLIDGASAIHSVILSGAMRVVRVEELHGNRIFAAAGMFGDPFEAAGEAPPALARS